MKRRKIQLWYASAKTAIVADSSIWFLWFQVSVKMVRNGVPVNDVNLLEISSSTDDVALYILDEPFAVAFNMPWISSITLPTSILANFYVYPSQIEMQCGNSDETSFVWYRGMEVNCFCGSLNSRILKCTIKI